MTLQRIALLTAVLSTLVAGCNPDASSSGEDTTSQDNDSSAEQNSSAEIEVTGLRTQVTSYSDNYHELSEDEYFRTLHFQVAVDGGDLPDDVHSIEAWYPDREEWSHLTDTAIMVGPNASDMVYANGVFYSKHYYTPVRWNDDPDVHQRLRLDDWRIRVTEANDHVHLLDLALDVPPEDAGHDADYLEALQYEAAKAGDLRALGLVSGTITDMSAETVTLNISYQDPRIRTFRIVVYSALAEEDGELRPLGETVEYRMEDLNIEADGQPLQLTFSRDDLAWWGRPDNPEQEYFTSDIVEYRIYANSARVDKDGFPHPSAAFRSIHRYELPKR